MIFTWPLAMRDQPNEEAAMFVKHGPDLLFKHW